MCGADNTRSRDCTWVFSIDQVPNKCSDFGSLVTMLNALGTFWLPWLRAELLSPRKY